MWIVALIVILVFVAIFLMRRRNPKNGEPEDDALFGRVKMDKFPEFGSTHTCEILVDNMGDTIWKPGEVRLGVVGDFCPFAPIRVTLREIVEPGESTVFSFVAHYTKAGPYTFRWQMVREGVRWFGEIKDVIVEVKEAKIKPVKVKRIVCWANIIDEMNCGYPIRTMALKMKKLGITVWRLTSFFVGRTEMPYEMKGGKYDLNEWNDEYWERLKFVVRALLEAGIKPWLDWVEFCCIATVKLWKEHPWNRANGGFAREKADILSNEGRRHIKRFIEKGIEEIESLAPGRNVKNYLYHGTDNEARRLVGAFPRPRNWVFFMSRVLQDAGVKAENIATSANENHSKIALVRKEDDPYGFLYGKYKRAVGLMGFHGWVEEEEIEKTLLWMYQVHRWRKGIKYVISTDGGNGGSDSRCDRYHKGWRPGPADVKVIMGGLMAKEKEWIKRLGAFPGVTREMAEDIIDHIAGAEYLDWITRKNDYDNILIDDIAEALREAVLGK